jgi:hypothetical protein
LTLADVLDSVAASSGGTPSYLLLLIVGPTIAVRILGKLVSSSASGELLGVFVGFVVSMIIGAGVGLGEGISSGC